MFSSISSLTRRFTTSTRFIPSLHGQALFVTGAAASATSLILLAIVSDHDETKKSIPGVLSTLATATTTRLESQNTASEGESDNDELFHGQCLKRQMHIPVVPYPLWDYNWDGKMTDDTSLEAFREGRNSGSSSKQKEGEKSSRKKKSRHLLLVRHGQYDERSSEDKDRKLTPLGRKQAIQTGIRLAEIAKGSANFEKERFNGKCKVKTIYVSDMTRAKETANLIAKQFHESDNMVVQEPDPLLNEALPAPMVPIRPDILGATKEIDEHHDRIEEAFQKYFYRDDEGDDEDDDDEHAESDDFEIVVCHGNVIRYFFCRALQLPPEAWLRLCTFNCSITYLVIRPNGMVSARMMGDIGHLDYDESTFSGYHGFKW